MKHETGMKLLTASLALALTACGGGGGTTSQLAPAEPVSGKVADGYLNGATVCLDVNDNKVCDSTEPTAISGIGGVYSIDAAELAKLGGAAPSLYPVVVQVGAETVDEDTGTVVGKAYTLSAPAGKPEFVSPITTLIQQSIETAEASGQTLSAEDAEQQVKTQLNVDAQADLFEDYVEAQEAGTSVSGVAVSEMETIHMVAQVVARALGEMQSVFEEAAGNQEIDFKLVVAQVVDAVVEQLGSIVAAVETHETGGGSIDSFNADSSVATNVTIPTTEEAKADLVVAQVEAAAAVTGFGEALAGNGISWFDFWTDGSTGEAKLESGTVILDTSNQLQETEEYYDFSASQWLAETGRDGEQDFALTSTGWLAVNDGPDGQTISLNADGTATLVRTADGARETISVAAYDVSGKEIATVAGELGELVANPYALFPAGSMAYKMSFRADTESYELWVDEWSAVRVWNADSPSNVPGFAAMLEAFALNPSEQGNYLWIENGLSVQFGQGGALHFYQDAQNVYPPVSMDLQGSWDDVNVQGAALIKMDVPAAYANLFDVEDAPIFAEWTDGTVRRGAYVPAGSVETEDEFSFNSIAFDAIKDRLDYAALAGGSSAVPNQPEFASPPLAADVTAFTLATISGKTFVYTDAEEVGIISFNADGTLADRGEDQYGAWNDAGSWSLDAEARLLLEFAGDPELSTLSLLSTSAAEELNIYYEDSENGTDTGTGYVDLQATVPASVVALQGNRYSLSEGGSISFDTTYLMATMTEPTGSVQGDYSINVDGSISLYMSDETSTFFRVAGGTDSQFDIVGYSVGQTGAMELLQDSLTLLP